MLSTQTAASYLNFEWVNLHIKSAIHGTFNFIVDNIQQGVIVILIRPLKVKHHLANSTWAIVSELVRRQKQNKTN